MHTRRLSHGVCASDNVSMKLFIASDIHGASGFCGRMLEAYDREGADRLLLLGDLLYHGPRNGLPTEYDPKAVIEMLNSHRNDILCVRGNCDTEVDQMVLEFPIMADYALLEIDGISIFATHGHLFNATHPPILKDGDVLLHGHTHIPAWEENNGWFYLNPGSVSIPKDGSHHGYMLLEDGIFTWKELDGSVCHRLPLR